MTNRYETVFILTPVLSEDQTKEAVTKFKDLLKAGSGKVRHEESWGMRKLAYPIQKKSSGFYHLIEFESDLSFIAKLETEYRRDERVIRFLTIVPWTSTTLLSQKAAVAAVATLKAATSQPARPVVKRKTPKPQK
jgi:small subunit ribosomal protein S6